MPSLETEARRIAEVYVPPEIGRPSELADPQVLTDFLKAVRDGNYIETACGVSGLGKTTVYRWLKTAEQSTDQNSPECRFRNALENARAMSEAEDVANVRRAGKLPQFWAASATYLERRYPDRWGKRPESYTGPQVTVLIGAQTEHVIQVLDPSNHNASYQTQTEHEGLIPPTFTSTNNELIRAKVLGESDSSTGKDRTPATSENP